MTKPLLLLHLALATCLLTGCIQDEPLNAECDITAVNAQWLEQHRDMLIGNPILGNDHLSFSIQKGTDRTSLDPSFTLTEGARITCLLNGQEVEANGITRNFSSPQTYTRATHSTPDVTTGLRATRDSPSRAWPSRPPNTPPPPRPTD